MQSQTREANTEYLPLTRSLRSLEPAENFLKLQFLYFSVFSVRDQSLIMFSGLMFMQNHHVQAGCEDYPREDSENLAGVARHYR